MLKLTLYYSSSFKKDMKKLKDKPKEKEQIAEVIKMLQHQIPLPAKHRDHSLLGSYKGYRECHVLPDLLLIYKIEQENLILALTRVGSHSQLF